jgi:predicted nucleotidyltransferase
MANIFNRDFQDFIQALNQSQVDYILVGGYAVILHGYARTTGDMDIWVKAVASNYKKLLKAFEVFGMSVFDMTETRFLDTSENKVFSFGRPPVSIDIITKIKGLAFDEALASAEWLDIEGDFRVRVLNLNSLITAKKASGRNKDLDDIENLEA